LHLLDVGRTQYGDAILVRGADRIVLVDGAHPDDAELIGDQLRHLTGVSDRPIRVDLLVVTHAHDDHIGCLPELVAGGVLRADWALVPKVALAWPREDARELDEGSAAVLAGLREEDLTFLADEALRAALDSARSLKARYEEMLTTLEKAKTRVIQYDGTAPEELLESFAPIGLRVIGPSARHLALAAHELGAREEILRAGLAYAEADALVVEQPTDLYRRLAGAATGEPPVGGLEQESLVEAVRRAGAAVNAQSIVIAIGDTGARVLMTGDMQFAEPGVPADLTACVKDLWDDVVAAGPYAFVKLAHHGSHNGSPADISTALGSEAFGLCTGVDSGHHPSCAVIDALARSAGVRWIRTDRNGPSDATVRATGVDLAVTTGELSDPACH
jgi:beta-lactamase superfamily II metal-dependent hydrolase